MFPTYYDIANNIKNLIGLKGMKQSVVAHRAGFSPQDFSNMLNGRRKLIRIEHLPLIAKALDVSVDELFNVRDKEK